MFAMVDEDTRDKYARLVGQKGLGERHEMERLVRDTVNELNAWWHV